MFHQHTSHKVSLSESEMSESEMSATASEMSESEMSTSASEMSESEMGFLESEGLMDSLSSVKDSLLNKARHARKKIKGGKDKYNMFLESMKKDPELVHKVIQRYIAQVNTPDGTISQYAMGEKVYKWYFMGKADAEIWTDFKAWSSGYQWLPTTTIELVIKLFALMRTHTKKSNQEINIGQPKGPVAEKAAKILGLKGGESKEQKNEPPEESAPAAPTVSAEAAPAAPAAAPTVSAEATPAAPAAAAGGSDAPKTPVAAPAAAAGGSGAPKTPVAAPAAAAGGSGAPKTPASVAVHNRGGPGGESKESK